MRTMPPKSYLFIASLMCLIVASCEAFSGEQAFVAAPAKAMPPTIDRRSQLRNGIRASKMVAVGDPGGKRSPAQDGMQTLGKLDVFILRKDCTWKEELIFSASPLKWVTETIEEKLSHGSLAEKLRSAASTTRSEQVDTSSIASPESSSVHTADTHNVMKRNVFVAQGAAVLFSVAFLDNKMHSQPKNPATVQKPPASKGLHLPFQKAATSSTSKSDKSSVKQEVPVVKSKSVEKISAAAAKDAGTSSKVLSTARFAVGTAWTVLSFTGTAAFAVGSGVVSVVKFAYPIIHDTAELAADVIVPAAQHVAVDVMAPAAVHLAGIVSPAAQHFGDEQLVPAIQHSQETLQPLAMVALERVVPVVQPVAEFAAAQVDAVGAAAHETLHAQESVVKVAQEGVQHGVQNVLDEFQPAVTALYAAADFARPTLPVLKFVAGFLINGVVMTVLLTIGAINTVYNEGFGALANDAISGLGHAVQSGFVEIVDAASGPAQDAVEIASAKTMELGSLAAESIKVKAKALSESAASVAASQIQSMASAVQDSIQDANVSK